VGLHPQLVAIDVTRSDGSKVGFNPRTIVNPRKAMTFQWYAGEVKLQGGRLVGIPVEFGATNLVSSDRIKHANKGAIAALIVEPRGATWTYDTGTRTAATVTRVDGTSFREFVVLFQDDINLRFGSGFAGFAAGAAVPNLADAEDAEDSGQKAFNYRTEPLWFRMGFAPNTALSTTRGFNFRNALSNAQVGGDPKTPVFRAAAGEPVRFRVLQPAGHARNHVFQLHGHIWEELPYLPGSRRLGSNPFSEWKGAQNGHGPSNHFDVLLKNGAGGAFGIQGDYLFRDMSSFMFDGGLWGILRVGPGAPPPPPPPPPLEPLEPGGCYIDPATGKTTC
jgi:hypothetical protein